MTADRPRRPARKYLAIARASLATLATYRARVVSMFLFYTMIMFVFQYLWRAIYGQSAVAGYTLEQMVWYLCCTEIISFGARTRTFGEIGSDVKSGAIAYQLCRPYNFVGYHFAIASAEIGMGLATVGTLGIVLGFAFVGPIPGYDLLGIPLGLLSMLLGIALQYFLHMCAALTALWLEDAGGVMLILNKLVYILGTFIPVEFLPAWLQKIARLLPFSYVAWGPSRLIVGFSWRMFWEIVPVQIAWLLLFVGLSQLLYKRGMKALEAHGG